MSKKKPKPAPVKPRVEGPKLLGRNGGYVSDPRYALGGDSRYASVPPKAILSEEDYRHIKETEHPPEPESPDLSEGGADEWIVKEARERDQERAEGKQLWELVRELEEKGLTERQKASIRKRVEAARRAQAA